MQGRNRGWQPRPDGRDGAVECEGFGEAKVVVPEPWGDGRDGCCCFFFAGCWLGEDCCVFSLEDEHGDHGEHLDILFFGDIRISMNEVVKQTGKEKIK